MQFRLRQCFVATIYFAVCCSIYTHHSVWLGTLVVASTVLILTWTTVRAFNQRSKHLLAFSVGSWCWLVLLFGFWAESPTRWDVDLLLIYDFFNLYRPRPESTGSAPATYAYSHSLYLTNFPMAVSPPVVPSWYNVIRLAACWSSLLAGLVCVAAYGAYSSIATRSAVPRASVRRRAG